LREGLNLGDRPIARGNIGRLGQSSQNAAGHEQKKDQNRDDQMMQCRGVGICL
jgi:hypothetical protein